MSSSLTKYVDYATLPTGIPSKLSASVKNLEIEKYLTDFEHEIHFTDRIEVDDRCQPPTVRPPFETLVAFRSPAGEKKERYMAVFDTKHCQILRSPR